MTENEIKNTKEWFEDFIKTYALSNQETIEFQKAVACLEEIQQYRAIGLTPKMVKDLIASEKKAHKTALENANMLDEYKEIGTIEEFKDLKEKSTAKKPRYEKMVYPKHKWREENGKVDEFAFSVGYCNGPVCERCYYSFCEHCNPDGWNGKCVVKDYICPSCNEKVGYKKEHCDCGQKLDWSE